MWPVIGVKNALLSKQPAFLSMNLLQLFCQCFDDFRSPCLLQLIICYLLLLSLLQGQNYNHIWWKVSIAVSLLWCIPPYIRHFCLTMLPYLQTGVLTLTLTNPIWVTKTRLVLQYNADRTSKEYKGMFDALVKIYRHEGVPGLYRVSQQWPCGFSISDWFCVVVKLWSQKLVQNTFCIHIN